MMKKEKTYTLVLFLLLTLCACRQREAAFLLEGAWTLRHAEHPIGTERDFTIEGGGTFCRIYRGDSVFYECRIAATPTGLVIVPTGKSTVTLIDKGGGEWLYLEGGDPHPITIGPHPRPLPVREGSGYSCNEELSGISIYSPPSQGGTGGGSVGSEKSLTIQSNGTRFTYAPADGLYREWGEEICAIIDRDLQADPSAAMNRYVLSAKERRQARTISWGVACLLFVVLALLVAAHLAITNRRARRQLQLQLQQIQEVQENRSPQVRQAVATHESAFFASDEYAVLQKRIATGQRLKEEEWGGVELLLKTVYPGFTTQLRSLYAMSELERQVCLLIKLRIGPKDIAAVLARDVSTISTVRSRLFKKVFGRKGGAREWDEFIYSIAR